MRMQEVLVGNYCKSKSLQVRGSQRKAMIILIEKLHCYRKCAQETLYTAVSIADKYLKKLASLNQTAPDLNLLSVTCLFMASKLEQHQLPNSKQIIIDLYKELGIKCTR